MADHPPRFESLANEVLLELLGYVDIRTLYRSVWGLNWRLNCLIQSLNGFSLVARKNDEPLIELFASQIVRLKIEDPSNIDLTPLVHLERLIVEEANEDQVEQIQAELMPNLTYLSLSVKSECDSLSELADQVFSNEFPLLNHAQLGNFDSYYFPQSWSGSPHLRSVCLVNLQSDLIPFIFVSCPNLQYLKVHLPNDDEDHVNIVPRSTGPGHPLKRFVLSADPDLWHNTDIDSLLTHVPYVERFELDLWHSMTIVRLLALLVQRLQHLKKFDCFITVHPDDNRPRDLKTVQAMHPCFGRMSLTFGPDDYLEFTQ